MNKLLIQRSLQSIFIFFIVLGSAFGIGSVLKPVDAQLGCVIASSECCSCGTARPLFLCSGSTYIWGDCGPTSHPYCNSNSFCPPAPPPGPVCGDNFCEGTENCNNCVADCGSCCAPTNPNPPTLNSPANNATINTLTPTMTWNTPPNFGSGCPNVNRVRVYRDLNCTGAYTNVSGNLPAGQTSYAMSGLSWNQTYCWLVQATNGPRVTNSAVFRFTTEEPVPAPTFQGLNTEGDFCGAGISGRTGEQTQPSNPIDFRFSFNDTGGPFLQSWFAIVPATGVYAETRNIVDAGTVNAKAFNSDAIAIRYDRNGNNVSVLNSPSIWGSSQTSGSLSNPQNTAVVESINSVTNTSISGGNLNSAYRIRFNNSFPDGTYNLYALVLIDANGTTISSHSSNPSQWVYRRVGTWRIDSNSPSASLVGPTSLATPNQFQMTWAANDENGIQDYYGYIYADTSTARLRDGAGEIPISNIPLTFPADPPNATLPAGANPLNNTRTYEDLAPDTDAVFTYRLYAEDNACNISETTQSAELVDPWMMAFDNTLSAAGGISLDIPNVPDFTSFVSRVLPDATVSVLNNSAVLTGSDQLPRERISQQGIFSRNYNNLATRIPSDSNAGSWYEHLLDLITANQVNSGSAFTTSGATRYSGSLSTIFSAPINRDVVVETTGNVQVDPGTICDLQAVIFVDGDLSIAPDFIKAQNTNGCLFVVRDTTTIQSGNQKTGALLSATAPSEYDVIEAGLITPNLVIPVDNIDLNRKWDGLFINGLVYANTVSANRDLNSTANNNQPAHIFKYDANLLRIFQDDLAERSFSIRELSN